MQFHKLKPSKAMRAKTLPSNLRNLDYNSTIFPHSIATSIELCTFSRWSTYRWVLYSLFTKTSMKCYLKQISNLESPL